MADITDLQASLRNLNHNGVNSNSCSRSQLDSMSICKDIIKKCTDNWLYSLHLTPFDYLVPDSESWGILSAVLPMY